MFKKALLLLFALALFAIPAKCQTYTYTPGTANACTVSPCTGSISTSKPGDTFIVGVMMGSPTATAAVTDTQGNTFSKIVSSPWGASGQFGEALFIATNAKGGSDTFSVAANTGYIEVHPYGYTGLVGIDVTGTAVTAIGAASATTSPVVTQNSIDMIFAYVHSDSGAVNTPGTGFTGRSHTGPTYYLAEDMSVNATGSYTGTMGFNIKCNYVAFVIAMKIGSALPPSPPSVTGSSLSSIAGTLTVSGTCKGASCSTTYDSGPNNPVLFTFVATAHSVTLTWSPSPSAGIIGNQIFRSQVSGSYPSTALGNTLTSTYTDATVVAGQTYYYVVQAMAAPCTATTPAGTACGNSLNSNEVKVVVPTP
jgi:hypothetical protein